MTDKTIHFELVSPEEKLVSEPVSMAIVVLAEQATDVADLDQAAVEQSIANLREDIARAEEGTAKTRAENALALENAKLTVLTGKFAA